MTIDQARARIGDLEEQRSHLCAQLNANAPKNRRARAQYDANNHHLIQPLNDAIQAIRRDFAELRPAPMSLTPRQRRALRDEQEMEVAEITFPPSPEDDDYAYQPW